MNNSGIHPKGERILIQPEEVEKVSQGGIIMLDSEKQGLAQVYGHLVAHGVDAWSDYAEPFAAVGDRIMFAKYGGLLVTGMDGVAYRVMNDTDVTATVHEELGVDKIDSRQSISKQKEEAA